MLRVLFCLSITAIIYAYAGYPLIVWMMARFRRRPVHKKAITPKVSVVLACHNESRNIESRLRNLLECDYPAEQLEIILVSDGSTALTAEIGRRFEHRGVRVLAYEKQQGKAIALNT